MAIAICFLDATKMAVFISSAKHNGLFFLNTNLIVNQMFIMLNIFLYKMFNNLNKLSAKMFIVLNKILHLPI